MIPQPLYDLSPVAQLGLMGVLLALGPLLWVWMRHRGAGSVRRLQALTLLTLFLTFDLTLFGAFTRLSDSGLGCPDWPGCYGNASPVGARHEIAMAQTAQPTGPVTHGKAWVEMLHRYLAMAVGTLIVALTLGTWWQRRRERREANGRKTMASVAIRAGPRGDIASANDPAAVGGPRALGLGWSLATLAWVCLQGAFGALTVTLKLYPAVVTLHLLGAIVLLVLLCIQAVRYRQADRGHGAAPVVPALRGLLIATTGLLVLQIALGGWVSTNYAVLACAQFPLCQNSWWPPMDFAQGFQIWRHLGVDAMGDPIDFRALTAIHYVHRLMAYVVFVALGVLAWRLHRVPALRPQARWLGGLALLQLATGLGNVLLGWPLAAALLHTGGAAALMVVLTWTLCESTSADGVRANQAKPAEATGSSRGRVGRHEVGSARA